MTVATLIALIPFPIVRDYAIEFNINPNLIAAIIMQESHGQECAIRFEPRWRYHWNVDAWAKEIGSSIATERVGQATSWGLMQVMGTVSRERGFTGWFPELCKPEVGVWYGAKVLSEKMDDYPKDHDAIAAYNFGSPKRWTEYSVNEAIKRWTSEMGTGKRKAMPKIPKAGEYLNQEYVDSVLKHLKELERQ